MAPRPGCLLFESGEPLGTRPTAAKQQQMQRPPMSNLQQQQLQLQQQIQLGAVQLPGPTAVAAAARTRKAKAAATAAAATTAAATLAAAAARAPGMQQLPVKFEATVLCSGQPHSAAAMADTAAAATTPANTAVPELGSCELTEWSTWEM
jgi:hypothetical protein